MKPLVWILLIATLGLLNTGWIFISRHRVTGKPSVELKFVIAITSILIGVISGFVFFIPVLYLVFAFMPNNPHNGHVSMPIGQVIIGIFISIILGLVSTIMAYKLILKRKIKQAVTNTNLLV